MAKLTEMNEHRERRVEPICGLPASGFTETPETVLEWAERAVQSARQELKGAAPMGTLWAYRHADSEYLSCDVYNEDTNASYGITFVVGARQDFTYASEPHVSDMSDALHIAGIFTEALQVKVTVGRRRNEVNAAVLSRPLGPNETNGVMRAVGVPVAEEKDFGPNEPDLVATQAAQVQQVERGNVER